MTKIKLSKEVAEFLTMHTMLRNSDGEVWYNIPVWFKATEDPEVFEVDDPPANLKTTLI